MSFVSRQGLEVAALLGQHRQASLNAHGIASQSLEQVAIAPESSELPGDLVVIDFAEASAETLLQSYALRRPDCAMLLIGNDLPMQAVRSLFRFAASDVLDADCGPADVQAACERLSAQFSKGDPKTAEPSGAGCWALRGAVGGSGVTTLAIEMAFAALRERPSWRVCLVDLNLTDGVSAAFLDAQKKLDVGALASSPERIDGSLLGAYAYEHPKGIYLMAAPRNPAAEQLARPEGVLALLDVTCSMFDHVIVDMPRHRSPWSDNVLGAVDEVFIVSELTVPSLHAAGDLCRETDALRQGNPSRLLLNRMFAKRSHRHSFPIEKAERAIHRKIDHTIRSDWEHARMAVNLGMPIAQVKPKSPLVKDVADCIDQLLGAEAAAQSRAA
jgi:pilus assembly protein CpaE